jgi:hypothetical protein
MTNTFLTTRSDVMEHLVCPTVTALIGTIVGAVLGGLIAFHFGKRLADQGHARQAAAAFAKAFLDELTRLQAKEDVDTHNILSPAFGKHQAAVQEFMFHLSESRQAELEDLWRTYYCHRETGIPFLEQYADCGSLDKRNTMRQQATERIETILRFARKT